MLVLQKNRTCKKSYLCPLRVRTLEALWYLLHVLALLSALKQNMQVLQSNVIDVQFVNILYLSSPECVRQSALLLDIEGFYIFALHIYTFHIFLFFRSSLGETTSATFQCQSLSKALEEKLTQGNKLYISLIILVHHNCYQITSKTYLIKTGHFVILPL